MSILKLKQTLLGNTDEQVAIKKYNQLYQLSTTETSAHYSFLAFTTERVVYRHLEVKSPYSAKESKNAQVLCHT